ncbi:YolD-like family protein [Bhargavaea beijingensis]|uniref:YolD-like family protein n=1 Tax=Bhargavaea beijingensis TaxID=426756 RepID=UPI00222527D8|nr:YolD-like family protein [Bhargavaea beijingensis]MCW1929549.1 YolD-like family protein [Bhargavaea beijingensis]
MIKDRGNIKWTAMMLPEHLEALRKWQAEDDLVHQPDLSEWDLEEIQSVIDTALRRKCQTAVQTWRAGEIRTHTGVIEDTDVRSKRIFIDGGWIEVGEIVSVRMME